MRIICNECGKSFNFSDVPKFCPFCGYSDVERDNKKQRESALKLIAEYNDIIERMEAFVNDYIIMSKRIKEIRRGLASYKHRKVISAEELPYEKNENLMTFIKRKIKENEQKREDECDDCK